MGLWARLHDGDHAEAVLKGYLRDASGPQFFANSGFPIQVDGTLGVTAAISEMLVQSHEGYIEFLPALPAAWGSGELDGVCVRGAFQLDMKWAAGQLTEVRILSRQGGVCRIRAADASVTAKVSVTSDVSVTVRGKRIPIKHLPNGIIEFPTEKGKSYVLQSKRARPAI